MKTYKEVNIPRKAVQEVKCDLCGATCPGEWGKGFQVARTEIKMREGEAYPEYQELEDTEVDICPTCFKEKLLPWLKSQGAVPTVTTIES